MLSCCSLACLSINWKVLLTLAIACLSFDLYALLVCWEMQESWFSVSWRAFLAWSILSLQLAVLLYMCWGIHSGRGLEWSEGCCCRRGQLELIDIGKSAEVTKGRN